MWEEKSSKSGWVRWGILAAGVLLIAFNAKLMFGAAGDDLLGEDKPADVKKKDDKKAGGDDLLGEDPADKNKKPPVAPAPVTEAPKAPKGDDPHAQAFAADQYPSASQCATCHKQIYEEWSSSNHAYASISPMFHKFEQKINDLAQGTVGFFCMRCHGSVGTTTGEPREKPLWERTAVSREGITCITCHRVKEEYNKVNGERRIEPGNIHKPVYGGNDGQGVKDAIADPNNKLKAIDGSGTGPGMDIHAQGIKFAQIDTSDFCVSCHQVAVHPGIKLEVVWDQYRGSPAFAQGVTCQQCHMGTKPGVPSGYDKGPSAVVNGKVVTPIREHHNHAFYGPGYPIAHPGIFPHNPRNQEFPIQTWLKFDFRAGWGSDDFEKKVNKKELTVEFPKEWTSVDDRQTSREIVTENLKKLEYKRELRKKVMENGTHLDGPFFDGNPTRGKSLSFHYVLRNLNSGHNMPSGSLGAQPEIWMNVALVSPSGKTVFESGYVDSQGDMADLHSHDVAAGRLKHDDQLFNLQTKFLTTNVKGTDREMYLPINIDIDQLPFIRPAGVPTTVLNHPPFVRMEGRSIPPLGDRKAKYTAPGSALTEEGTYKLAVRLRSRAEPIYFMKFCNATTEMEQAMNEWMIDIHPYAVEFEVK